jgi:hypothetical protein
MRAAVVFTLAATATLLTIGSAARAGAPAPAQGNAGPVSTASAAPPPATAEPQAIFEKAREAWAFTSYPRYANYTVTVRYRNGTATVMRRYDTLEDLRRDIVFAQTFSREETANPSTPHGINFGIFGMTLNAAQAADPIGPVALAITYDFGISLAERPTQVAQMGSEITAPDRYPVIGRTGTTAQIYTVRLIDTPAGGTVDHLGLTPLRDPGRYRLREMWVDAQTFVTRKILIASNFSRKPYTNVPWLVTFGQIGGGPYIREEQAQGALDFGDAGMLDGVSVSFGDIASTSALPRYGTVGINGGPGAFVTEP